MALDAPIGELTIRAVSHFHNSFGPHLKEGWFNAITYYAVSDPRY